MTHQRPNLRSLRPVAALLAVSLLLSLSPYALGDHDPSSEPYYHEFEISGTIGCSIGVHPLATSDWCAGIDPTARNDFEGPLDPYLTTMVFTIQTRDSPLGDPELDVRFTRPAGVFEDQRGPTPIYYRADFDENDHWPSWSDPADLLFNVRASSDAATPQIALQTSIHICIGLFYNHEPVPDGYHPCP